MVPGDDPAYHLLGVCRLSFMQQNYLQISSKHNLIAISLQGVVLWEIISGEAPKMRQLRPLRYNSNKLPSGVRATRLLMPALAVLKGA